MPHHHEKQNMEIMKKLCENQFVKILQFCFTKNKLRQQSNQQSNLNLPYFCLPDQIVKKNPLIIIVFRLLLSFSFHYAKLQKCSVCKHVIVCLWQKIGSCGKVFFSFLFNYLTTIQIRRKSDQTLIPSTLESRLYFSCFLLDWNRK